jgi:hypothetical protein
MFIKAVGRIVNKDYFYNVKSDYDFKKNTAPISEGR